MTPIKLNYDLCVATPSGISICASFMLKSCELHLSSEKLHVNLIILNILDFNVIFGMDLLSKYKAHID